MAKKRIENRYDYITFLKADALSMDLNWNDRRQMFLANFTNPRWRFVKLLRITELCQNSQWILLQKIGFPYYYWRYKSLGLRLGYSIPTNVFGKGLSLPHYGTIVVSKLASIGENCRIHVGVNIGGHNGGAPQLGNNIYIGPGAKLFGSITIADNCSIGANSVVNRSFPEANTIVAGVPAKVVKYSSSSWNSKGNNE